MDSYKITAAPMDNGKFWFSIKSPKGGTEKQPYGIITRQELKDLIKRLENTLAES